MLDRHVPRSLIERPKMGFGVPVGEWIRGPLLDWAESLLSEFALKRSDLFHIPRVRALWTAHRDRQTNDPYRVWALLMLQAWLSEQPK
ncbi:MAG: asparagine synthase-related protein [bacterium]